MNFSACWRSKEVLLCTFDFTHLTFRQNRVAVVSSVISTIFNPSKCWLITIQLPLNDTLFSVLVNIYCQLLTVRLLFFQCLLFDSVFIRCNALFEFDCFSQCSNYSVYVQSWSWKCVPCISIHLNTHHQTVNKHHTADSTIFCLCIGARGLIQS